MKIGQAIDRPNFELILPCHDLRRFRGLGWRRPGGVAHPLLGKLVLRIEVQRRAKFDQRLCPPAFRRSVFPAPQGRNLP